MWENFLKLIGTIEIVEIRKLRKVVSDWLIAKSVRNEIESDLVKWLYHVSKRGWSTNLMMNDSRLNTIMTVIGGSLWLMIVTIRKYSTEYEIEYEIIFRKNGPKLVEIRVWIYSWSTWHDFKSVQNIFKNNHKYLPNRFSKFLH